jgi:MFS family permease
MVVLAFSGADSVALGMLLQDIKVDLHLSDTQLGLLTGIAFALFYSIMGIPIARWADRGNRIAIIAITTAIWSAMVALYAIAGSFLQLLLIRVCAAVGEAGCNPPALSLISDHFNRAERPRAIGKYTLGWPLCWLVGYFATGWMNELFGWRTTFVLLGLPGLAVAGLVWLTLSEPRLTKAGPVTVPNTREDSSPTLREVSRGLWSSPTVRNLTAYLVVAAFFSTGAAQFQGAFLIRSYGLKTGELGTWFALIYGITGFLGTYGGGEWASRRAVNNERLQLRVMAIMYSCLAISVALIYLSTSFYMAIAMMAIAGLVSSIPSGPLYATVQTIVPPRTRATSAAIMGLLASLIGTGLGPLAAGALSDMLHPMFGKESLRYALLAFCPGYLWGGWHLWRASQTVGRDLEAAQDGSDDASERSKIGTSTVKKVLIAR